MRFHSVRLAASQSAQIAVLVAAAVAALAPATSAQEKYPAKPVRFVVGFAAGGPSDIVTRVVAARLAETMGQQFIVENRGGAGGTIGTEAVARADADGYTLLNTPLANAVNESIYKGRRIHVGEHLTSVAPLAETANVLVVHASLGVKTVADLITLAKSKPGELVYASAGRGTATHLTTELFNLMAGIKMTPVHYKGGGDTIKDLLSGEVKIMFSSIAPVLGFVRDGQLLGVATTASKRDPALPELPTVAEAALPGFDVRLWMGVLAPVGTPQPIIDLLSSEIGKAIEHPNVTKILAAQGFAPMKGGASAFDAFYRSEVAKWAKVVQATGMTAD
jgi:tripartite-type tricarboxylate transporter receptor subunit TctC